MGLVLNICDRVGVLEFGRVIADGAPEDVRRGPRVIAAYLGSSNELAPAADPAPAGERMGGESAANVNVATSEGGRPDG